jgi:hypothetical protein
MAAVGQFLYWAACVVAGFYVCAGAAGALKHFELNVFAVGATTAAFVWLVGRAALYVLARPATD